MHGIKKSGHMKLKVSAKLDRETLELFPRICEKCGKRETYSTATWCEPCLWNLIKDDQQK
jgi:hypothetical protein